MTAPAPGKPRPRPPRPKCGYCHHSEHKGECKRRGPSKCVPWGSAEQNGWMCGYRPQCPCPRRVCTCGALIAVTYLEDKQAAAFKEQHHITGPDIAIEVPVMQGSAGDPAGRLAVWKQRDGKLRCRELADGEDVAEGQWRGVEHTGPCQEL